MSAGPRIGWVVDAQVDFMDPQGRLYVRDLGDDTDPGSVQVIPTMERALSWMREHCDILVFTGDWHHMDDDEIDPVSPDPAMGTYPPHCMGRSDDAEERAGAEIVPQLRPDDPIVLEIGATDDDARDAARRAVAEGRPLFIHKNRFDVFTGNPATPALIHELEAQLGGRPTFVVMGVARDVCVTQAVDGLQAREYDVTALQDATWGLGLEAEEATLGRWRAKGHVILTAELG